MSLYIGLMSGTSMDGIDAALVEFNDGDRLGVVESLTTAYSETLRSKLANAIKPETRLSLDEIAKLDISVGLEFAQAASLVLRKSKSNSAEVVAIGSHGQTLRHSPESNPPYSFQIGDPATIAVRTSITTIADFRSLDLAAGGQGAPLVPAFHDAFFREKNENTVVINIGGIANITVLPAGDSESILGFDTGPGNCLLDEWTQIHRGMPFDDNGCWAASGSVSEPLLTTLMADEFIRRPPAKSTGREYFNLSNFLPMLTGGSSKGLPAADIQATLAAFTVTSIARSIAQTDIRPDRILVCGGGAKNEYMMKALRAALRPASVESTSAFNVNPDMVEAVAFAWFAKRRLELQPVRLTTGSTTRTRILGAIYESGGCVAPALELAE